MSRQATATHAAPILSRTRWVPLPEATYSGNLPGPTDASGAPPNGEAPQGRGELRDQPTTGCSR
ncbi:hypothetical protein GCM10010250_03090 [Streptomyces althioticus]|nr:hypothetical protein GCM10010250_03090 [Streptomyces althioticus]GGT56471.1 hypothetical protein GCM10010243_38710 [Streptomyces matensis]